MIFKTNNDVSFSKIIVYFTFFIAVGLYYTNPDQFVSDHSLFYPVVAQNIWETGVSTFNGYIETNGYQPLWMLCNIVAIAISSIFSFDPLIVIGFIYHLFLAGSLFFLFKIEKMRSFFSAPVVSLILIFMFISNGVLHNMESALALFFILFSLYYILKTDDPEGKNFFIFGLLLAFTFLARLDLFFFGAIFTIYILYVHRKRFLSTPVQLMYFILGIVIVISPYLVCNQLMFGQVLPISDALSGGLPTLEYAFANIYPYGTVSFFIALIEWGVAWMLKSRKARAVILILSMSTIAQIIYVALFQSPESWYFVTGFLNTAFVVGYFIKKLHIKWVTQLVLITLILLVVSTSYLKTISNYALSAHVLRLYSGTIGRASWIFSDESLKKTFGESFRQGLPKNATVYTWDMPGTLAYYGKLRVFAATGLSDGLIKNNIYQNELIENGVKNTFNKYNIEYIIVPRTKAKWFWYDSLLYKPQSDGNISLTVYDRQFNKTKAALNFQKDDIILNVPTIYNKKTSVGTFKISDTLWNDIKQIDK